MPLDVNALAVEVALAIKNATAPLLERIASLEAKQAVLGDVRDRVVTMEAKSLQVLPEPVVNVPPPVDLSPLLERIASAEARLSVIGDLRDRVVTIETKSAQPISLPVVVPPVPVDLSPVLERVAATEARLATIGDVRDRLAVVEVKADRPVPEPQAVDLAPVLQKIASIESALAVKADAISVAASVAELTKEDAAIRERVAVAELRPLLSGPKGEDGQNGTNGKDGADGVGFDDLMVVQTDERSVTVKAARGERVKDIGTLQLPVEIYRGVFIDGRPYERGDGVTWAGSEWHANESTTSKPGDGSKAWTLKVKRGRDGKDGRDALAPVPVVSVRK